jgi:oligopeptide/dipeptide ABC transporter ATP-binding protein
MEVIRTENLKKYFEIKAGVFGRTKINKALDGVDITLNRDSVLAIVGESGCGKSTLARLILRLVRPTGGSVLFRGRNVFEFAGEELKEFRRSVQIIFQDPFASLNPRMNIFSALSEPLRIHKIVPRRELKEKVVSLLESVGLKSEHMNRYPHEFSGGQRQRLCIARSLASSPEVIVADEPLSSLDVSIQAQIINLLSDLKVQKRLSFIFISHDLNVVNYFADTVAVMYLGRVVEEAESERIFREPKHPYTEMLLNSIPKAVVGGGGEERDKLYKGFEGSSVADLIQGRRVAVQMPEKGCLFYQRCPRRLHVCSRETPPLREIDSRRVACHLYR